MKKHILILTLSILFIGKSFCQEKDTIVGKIVQISNPCIESPCLPGTVFAIENDTANFILLVDNAWQWSNNELIINKNALELNDTIKVVGIISKQNDIHNKIFYEIKVDTTFFFTSITCIKNSKILIYPNPSEGAFAVTSNSLNIIEVEIISLEGRRLCLWKNDLPTDSIFFDSINKRGIIVLKIKTNNNRIITKKITIQ